MQNKSKAIFGVVAFSAVIAVAVVGYAWVRQGSQTKPTPPITNPIATPDPQADFKQSSSDPDNDSFGWADPPASNNTEVKTAATSTSKKASTRNGMGSGTSAPAATMPPTSSDPGTIGPTPTPTASCDSSSFNAYDTSVLADNPVAYYRLDGNAADCSGKARHGTLVASPASTTLPNGQAALAFNGATQYAEMADTDDFSISTTGKLTIEAWMRPDTLEFSHQEGTGYVHWMGKGETSQHEWLARMYSLTNSESRPNRISGYAFNLSGGLGVGSYFQDSVTTGQWIHYVLVINTTSSGSYPMGYTKIYKNGAQRDQDGLDSLSIVPGNGMAPLRIGTRDLNSFFEGAIGKVAIYNHELSDFDVVEHYQKMIPPVAGTASLVASVGQASSQTAGNTLAIPVTRTIPAGHTVITRVLQPYTAGAPTMSDTKGNVYTRDRTAPSTGSVMRASIFSNRLTNALQPGDTITITYSASIATRVAVADEFAGVFTGAGYIDVQNGTSGNSTTPNNAYVTTTNANDLLVSFVGLNRSTNDVYNEDVLHQWTSLNRAGTNSGSNDLTINGAYRSVGTTGLYDYTPTLEFSGNWTNFIMAYKAQ